MNPALPTTPDSLLILYTTPGQPLEVIKTQMASQRGDAMSTALSKVWGRGGVFGCESSLVPSLDPAPTDSSAVSLPGSPAELSSQVVSPDPLRLYRDSGRGLLSKHRRQCTRCVLLLAETDGLRSNPGKVVSCCSPLLRLRAPRATWDCLLPLLDCLEVWEEESLRRTRRWEYALA